MNNTISKKLTDPRLTNQLIKKTTNDEVYKSLKSTVDLIIKQLLVQLKISGSVVQVETFIQSYLTEQFQRRKNREQNISKKLATDTIDQKNGALSDILKASLEDIGNRAQAVTYLSILKTAQRKIDQQLFAFEAYIKGIYTRELSNYNTQDDRTSIIKLPVLFEKNERDILENLCNSLLYLITDIDKEIEAIKNINKTAELILK